MANEGIAAIMIDVPHDQLDAALRFWSVALGREPRNKDGSAYHWFPDAAGGLIFGLQRIEGGQSRVHLDVASEDVDAEVSRLEAAGAARVAQIEDWWQMRDPAGLLFCVIPKEDAPPSYPD